MIAGTVRVVCPACGRDHDVRLVQSINASVDVAEKQRLLAGDLDVLACECGRRTQLAANMLYSDPEHHVMVRVVPGADDAAMAKAAAQFRAAGAAGIQRLVPSLNALVEKIKIFDAGLEDWAVEMIKVLLLSTLGDLDRVLLFDRLDGDELRWVLFDAAGQLPKAMASPRDAYARIADRDASRPGPTEYQIDRAWAVGAVQAMIATTN
jgi:hypothetical protein